MKEIDFKSCKLIELLKFVHLFNFVDVMDYILKKFDLSIKKTWELILIRIVEMRNFFIILILIMKRKLIAYFR